MAPKLREPVNEEAQPIFRVSSLSEKANAVAAEEEALYAGRVVRAALSTFSLPGEDLGDLNAAVRQHPCHEGRGAVPKAADQIRFVC